MALRGTLSLSGAIVDVQGMALEFCLGLAHQGMAEMAEQVWEASGAEINKLFEQDEFKDYGLIITGHSLGAGTSCLLNIKLHVDKLVGNRPVKCYAFAPPPTFFPCNPDATGDGKADPPALVKKAIENTIAYIHDNDAVPFLSISSVRKLASLLDAVDNNSEFMWFYDRWAIFHEMKDVPKDIFDSVDEAAKNEAEMVDGECRMKIPARVVVWMQKDEDNNKFVGYGCDATKVAKNTVFMSQDMFSDHLPEQYEDALDFLLADQSE
uniref:sn-1-specific diacylglycerol lipase n=1 Tax=Minutocellus polymorphus TaxID=265543 RepID=A0A7S0ATE4_9STRA